MPVHTLTFSLPDDAEDLDDAMQGGAWRAVVRDIDQAMRRHLKYDDDLHPEAATAIEAARAELWGFIAERGLTLD